MKPKLPPRVHEKHSAYYLVSQNKWVRLCAVKEGVAAVYRALADMDKPIATSSMPAVVQQWQREVSDKRTPKTRANDDYMCRKISANFVEFRVDQVTPKTVRVFLKQFEGMPRTYNGYRATLRDIMKYAESEDLRPAGSNPVTSVDPMKIQKRGRYITDSEMRRIKVGAVYANPHPATGHKMRNRSGLMLCALIDLAYLTGQRIGDLLRIKWADVGRDGIMFAPAKVAESTGQKVLIEWTPRLRQLVERIKAIKRKDITVYLITTQQGQPFTYSGASTAWKRAVKRSGVAPCHFHDIRAKALTDKDGAEGIGEAQRMGGHSTQSQTADYVRHKTAVKTGATR
jgi:integrase